MLVVYTNPPKHTSDEEHFHPQLESNKKHVEEETHETLIRPAWSGKEKVRSSPEIIELGDPKWTKEASMRRGEEYPAYKVNM